MIKNILILILLFVVLGCKKDDDSSNSQLCNATVNLLTLEATNLGYFNATLNGEISLNGCDGFSVTSQGFVYGTNPEPTMQDRIIELEGENISAEIVDLELNAIYYYRLYLVTSDTIYYGNEISIVTPNPELTSITDSKFERALVERGIDNQIDGFVVTDVIREITELDLRNSEIQDFTGIEDFFSLESLNISSILSIEILDLSQNVNLKTLVADDSYLGSINLTQNVLLEFTSLVRAYLNDLDVTQNVLLRTLLLKDNNLSNLDVSQNVLLENLNVAENNLTVLNVDQNINLRILEFGQNGIGELNVSQNNRLTKIYGAYNNLNSLDVGSCPNLEVLSLRNNNISRLDLSQNNLLKIVNFKYNNLTEIDVSSNSLLEKLEVGNNNLVSLTTSSNNDKIKQLDCGSNGDLSEISISHLTNLEILIANSCNLSNIDLSQSLGIRQIYISGNNHSFLDLSQNTSLTSIVCGGVNLSSLNIANGNNENIRYLDALGSPNLLCVQADTINPTYPCSPTATVSWCIDPSAIFSTDCG